MNRIILGIQCYNIALIEVEIYCKDFFNIKREDILV